jgi:hypothetical protein
MILVVEVKILAVEVKVEVLALEYEPEEVHKQQVQGEEASR